MAVPRIPKDLELRYLTLLERLRARLRGDCVVIPQDEVVNSGNVEMGYIERIARLEELVRRLGGGESG